VEVEAKGGEGERLPTRSGLSKHSRAGGPLWRGGGARECANAALERAWARVGLVGGGSVHTHTCGARGTVQGHCGRAVGDCHGVSQPSQSVREAVGDGWCTVCIVRLERWPEAVEDSRTEGGRLSPGVGSVWARSTLPSVGRGATLHPSSCEPASGLHYSSTTRRHGYPE
jgi:hypothetical protein